jgi:2-amino-4-hydroxy-6-hydroxymethyldihydropteridine pyrophosphokinase
MGRTCKSSEGHYEDRIIDVDILLYGDLVIEETDLIIPHPLMSERLFVMQPLCEIAPQLVHPVLRKSIKELLISIQ